MPRTLLSLALLLPLAATAAGGSVTAASMGGITGAGGQTLVSRALAPALPPGARPYSLSWRIQLLGNPPAGLNIALCAPGGCLPLPGLAGRMSLSGAPALAAPLHFTYRVARPGRIVPALNVVQNQLTINYRQ